MLMEEDIFKDKDGRHRAACKGSQAHGLASCNTYDWNINFTEDLKENISTLSENDRKFLQILDNLF